MEYVAPMLRDLSIKLSKPLTAGAQARLGVTSLWLLLREIRLLSETTQVRFHSSDSPVFRALFVTTDANVSLMSAVQASLGSTDHAVIGCHEESLRICIAAVQIFPVDAAYAAFVNDFALSVFLQSQSSRVQIKALKLVAAIAPFVSPSRMSSVIESLISSTKKAPIQSAAVKSTIFDVVVDILSRSGAVIGNACIQELNRMLLAHLHIIKYEKRHDSPGITKSVLLFALTFLSTFPQFGECSEVGDLLREIQSDMSIRQ